MTGGSLFLIAVVVAMCVIGSKVKKQSKKLQELEENLSKK